jgi:hypothetical protein
MSPVTCSNNPQHLQEPSRQFTLGGLRVPITRVIHEEIMHHSLLDKRSLMLHEAIAAKLRADPSLLEKTRKWLSETVSNELFSQSVRDGYREWEQAISLCTFDQLLTLMTDPSEDAIRLRQSTPFVNILTQEERAEITRASGCYQREATQK